jgi:hypothetical protein
VTRSSQTVQNAGLIYAALPSALPFVTAAGFNTAQWRLLAGSQTVATRAALQALNPIDGALAYLAEGGRKGLFRFSAANLTAEVTSDPQQGLYVPPAATTSGAAGAWIRDWGVAMRIEWFGAVANDARACTLAFNAATAMAALTTGFVFLGSAFTYLHDAAWNVPDGVHVLGNGKTIIKRRDQVRMAITNVVTWGVDAADKIFDVANAAGLLVGQAVIFPNAAGTSLVPDDSFSHSNPVIKTIVGNRITVTANSVLTARVVGDFIQTGSRGFIINNDSQVSGIIVDGNYANQTSYHWIAMPETTIQGSRSKLDNVFYRNAPSDAVLVAGAIADVMISDCDITRCRFENIGGNAIHYGLSQINNVDTCKFIGTNKRNVGLGTAHNDGAVIYSDKCRDLTVKSSFFSDCRHGVGSIDGDNTTGVFNDRVIVEGCTFKDVYKPLYVASTASYVAFRGNRVEATFPFPIYDSCIITITGTGTTVQPAEICIQNNELRNATISLVWCINFKVTGNKTNNRDFQAQNANSFVNHAIEILQCSNGDVSGNLVNGGPQGIYLQSNSAFSDTAGGVLKVSGNFLYDQMFIAIQTTYGDAATGIDVQVSDNTIKNSSNAAISSPGGYAAIRMCPGMSASCNHMKLLVGAAWADDAPARRKGNFVNGAFVD